MDEEIDNIITLLERGEKYEQMWGKFKEYYELIIQFKKGIFEPFEKLKVFIEHLEQKYFPVE